MNRSLLALFLMPALVWVAPAQQPGTASATPFPEPAIPKNALAYWSSAKVIPKNGDLSVVDVIGGNNLTTAGWLTVAPNGGGLIFDGTQTAPARTVMRQDVFSQFYMGVDLQPGTAGPEYQTPVYIFGFCELRYRLSRSELTLTVWRRSIDKGQREPAGQITLPIAAGKWNRVQVMINGDQARLVVNGVVSESTLKGTWEDLESNLPLHIGFGGSDRAYQGRLDHLLFAEKP